MLAAKDDANPKKRTKAVLKFEQVAKAALKSHNNEKRLDHLQQLLVALGGANPPHFSSFPFILFNKILLFYPYFLFFLTLIFLLCFVLVLDLATLTLIACNFNSQYRGFHNKFDNI